MQAVKLAIQPNNIFFSLISLHPSVTIDELFQRGNQYAMLEDDTIAATRRTVAGPSKRFLQTGKDKAKIGVVEEVNMRTETLKGIDLEESRVETGVMPEETLENPSMTNLSNSR